MSEPKEIAAFPYDNVSKKVKATPAYGLTVSEAIYSRWWLNATLWGRNRVTIFDLRGQYLGGNQPIYPYQVRYRGLDRNGNLRRGYNNISWEINSPAPTNRSILQRIIAGADYMFHVESLCADAINEKALAKQRLWYETEMNETRKELSGILGAEIPLKEHYWEPESKEELESFEKYGGFKLPMERGLTKIAEDICNISNWDYVWENALDECLKTSYIVGRVIDKPDGSTAVEYIQTKDYFCSYNQNSYVDPPYEGHFAFESLECLIPKLKQAYPDITDSDIESIAKANMSRNGTTWNNQNFKTPDGVTGRFPYYDFMIQVFYFVYKSVDVSGYTTKVKEDGSVSFIEEEDGKEYNTETKQTEKYNNVTYYEGCRIVGLPWVVDFGPMKNIIRNGDGSPASPYVRETTGEASIVERWTPDLDNYQMADLKYRVFLMKMKGDRTIYDTGVLANMDFGAGKLTQTELVRYGEETGDLYVATRGGFENKIDAKSAIVDLPAVNAAITNIMGQLQFLEMKIRRAAGITDAIAATSNQSPDKLVGVGQQEIQAAQNSAYTIQKAMMRWKEKLLKKAIAKTRVKLEFAESTRKYYTGNIGESLVRNILAYKDLTTNQIGLNFKVKPSSEITQVVYQLILESMKAGKNGQVGVSTHAGMMALKELNDGYLDYAIWYISLEEERIRKVMAEQAARNTQEQGQVQIQSAQAAAQAELQVTERIKQLESMLTRVENQQKIADQMQADLKVNEQTHNFDMREMAVQGLIDSRKEANKTQAA